MDITDRFLASPKGDNLNEDRLATRYDAHGKLTGVAVIDGATSSGTLHDGFTGGWWAAQLAANAFAELPAEATLNDFCRAVQEDYSTFLVTHATDVPLYASFAAAVKRESGYELWRVGDVMMGYRSAQPNDSFHTLVPVPKKVDAFTASVRSFTISSLMLAGETDPHELTVQGRACLEPLLARQLIHANQDIARDPFAFGVLCAERDVPQALQQFKWLDAGSTVVLASDGFTMLDPDISTMLRHLEGVRHYDPHLIGVTSPDYARTKGFYGPDGTLRTYFDDTAAVVVKL